MPLSHALVSNCCKTTGGCQRTSVRRVLPHCRYLDEAMNPPTLTRWVSRRLISIKISQCHVRSNPARCHTLGNSVLISFPGHFLRRLPTRSCIRVIHTLSISTTSDAVVHLLKRQEEKNCPSTATTNFPLHKGVPSYSWFSHLTNLQKCKGVFLPASNICYTRFVGQNLPHDGRIGVTGLSATGVAIGNLVRCAAARILLSTRWPPTVDASGSIHH